jgi:hypothetical protein
MALGGRQSCSAARWHVEHWSKQLACVPRVMPAMASAIALSVVAAVNPLSFRYQRDHSNAVWPESAPGMRLPIFA